MSRQWMYMADQRSKEFIDAVHEFIEAAEKHKYGGSFVVHANSVRMRRITHLQEPSTITSIVVSYRTTMFGPSREKEELCWIIM